MIALAHSLRTNLLSGLFDVRLVGRKRCSGSTRRNRGIELLVIICPDVSGIGSDAEVLFEGGGRDALDAGGAGTDSAF